MSALIETELCDCRRLKAVNRKCRACGTLNPAQPQLPMSPATAGELLAAVSGQEFLNIMQLARSKRK
jgi:hypothetical protein